MFKKFNLHTKFIFIIVPIITISILTASYLAFLIAKKSLKSIRIEELEIVANLKVDAIENFLNIKKANTKTAQDYYNIKTNLPILSQHANDRTNPAYIQAKNMLDSQLKTFQKIYDYLDVMLVDEEGKIVYATNEAHAKAELDLPLHYLEKKAFEEGKKGIYITDIFINKLEGYEFEMLITAPAHDFNGTFVGVIALEVNMEPVYKLIQDTMGLGETGETLIGLNNGDHAICLNPLRHDQDAALKRKINFGEEKGYPLQKAVQGNKGSGLSVDYRGEEVIAAWRYIPSLDWGLVAKIDSSEAFAPVIQLKQNIIIFTSGILVLSLAVAIMFSKTIARPIKQLSDVVNKINLGDLKVRAEIKSRDEIGMLADSFNKMTDSLVDAKSEGEQNSERLELLLSSIPSIIIELTKDNKVNRWSTSAEYSFGIEASDVIDRSFRECSIQWDWGELFKIISLCKETNNATWIDDFKYKRPDGDYGFLDIITNPIKDKANEQIGILISMKDITKNKNMEEQLFQAQKLEAIGQLASGIAHEINTPTQFISDNTFFLQDAFSKIATLLNKYSHLLEMNKAGSVTPELINEVDDIARDNKVEHLVREIPEAIKETQNGLRNVIEIVQSMNTFSHPDVSEKVTVDINEMIKSTITVSRNEWKYVADIETDFDSELPPVSCYPGEFNQAILNLIINAAHAIGEVSGDGGMGKGKIGISTRHDGDWAEIHISDTGAGIPEEIRSRIFEPFFTTKEVGKGTGQGLSIAHSVVVGRHNGRITFATEIGKGTTFIIHLPLDLSQVGGREERVLLNFNIQSTKSEIQP